MYGNVLAYALSAALVLGSISVPGAAAPLSISAPAQENTSEWTAVPTEQYTVVYEVDAEEPQSKYLSPSHHHHHHVASTANPDLAWTLSPPTSASSSTELGKRAPPESAALSAAEKAVARKLKLKLPDGVAAKAMKKHGRPLQEAKENPRKAPGPSPLRVGHGPIAGPMDRVLAAVNI